jgi:hypothetical protein
MRLPDEVRNAIYGFACCQGTISIYKSPKCTLRFGSTPLPRPGYQGACALLHTYRQMRYEACSILCTHTTFDLRNLETYDCIYGRLGPEVCNTIRSIRIDMLTADMPQSDYEHKQDSYIIDSRLGVVGSFVRGGLGWRVE